MILNLNVVQYSYQNTIIRNLVHTTSHYSPRTVNLFLEQSMATGYAFQLLAKLSVKSGLLLRIIDHMLN